MFYPNLKLNQVISQSQLSDLFEIKTLRTSRFIKDQNTLVLITDFSKGDQLDKWIDGVLHFTGETKITNVINSKIADSRNTKIHILLFQMLSPKEYTYCGSVSLAGDPYTTMQTDKNGADRLVWVFPLKPKHPVETIPELTFADMEDFKNRGEQALRHYVRRRDNYKGYPVYHKEHGLGVVDTFDGSLITVTFQNNETKTYNFQKSTQGGYLQFPD